MFIKLVHRDTLSVEATVERAPNGDLLLLCTCGGTGEPQIENRVLSFRSKDDGKAWTKGTQIHEEDGRAHYQTETARIGDEIRVFISTHDGKFLDWKNYFLSSYDSGETWQKHPLPELDRFAFVRGKVDLSNGEMIFPYHAYPIDEKLNEESKRENRPAYLNAIEYVENGLLVSRDGGKTFERRVAFYTMLDESFRNSPSCRFSWNENTVVELKDGHLVMLYRLDRSGWLWRSDSYDYGNTWSEPFRTDIPNPSNKPRLLKAPDGKIILLNTPNANCGLVNRHPLEIWISDDGMKTWGKKISLSNFPGMYSYPDGFIDENNCLYAAFEFNRHDIYFFSYNLNEEQ